MDGVDLSTALDNFKVDLDNILPPSDISFHERKLDKCLLDTTRSEEDVVAEHEKIKAILAKIRLRI